MIRYAEIPIGSAPPSGCALCAPRPAAKPLPLAEIVPVIEAAAATRAAHPGPDIAFTGYEPFSHPELPGLIAAARAADSERIMLTTDGRFLDQGGNAFGAYSAGVTHVRLVLFAGDVAHHDRSAGASGAFDAACRGAAAWTAAGASALLTGLVPLCRHSIAHAPAAIARLASLGAVAVELDASGLRERAGDGELVAAALETATVNRVAASVAGWHHELPAQYLVAPWTVARSGA